MRVSVIVCTYSIELLPDTLDCIKSLMNQTFSNLEIILVMDTNDDLYKLLIEKIPREVKLVINPIPGLSAARNMGIEQSEGDILIFIDDDAAAAPDFVENLVKNYEDPSVIGAGGKIIPKGKPRYPEELYWIGGFTYKGFPECKCNVRNVHGCNMSFRREVFRKVGLFDVNLGRVGKKLVTAEETEFSLRVLNIFSGYRIVYDPSAIVYHKVHFSRDKFEYLLRRCYHEGSSKALIKSSQKKMQKKNAIIVESDYLFYLYSAVKNRLKETVKGKNIMVNVEECFKIIMAIIMVGIGYFTQDICILWREKNV